MLFCWLETAQFVLWYHLLLYHKVPINILINIITQELIISGYVSIKIDDSIILPGFLTEKLNLDGYLWILSGGHVFVEQLDAAG